MFLHISTSRCMLSTAFFLDDFICICNFFYCYDVGVVFFACQEFCFSSNFASLSTLAKHTLQLSVSSSRYLSQSSSFWLLNNSLTRNHYRESSSPRYELFTHYLHSYLPMPIWCPQAFSGTIVLSNVRRHSTAP